MPEEDWGATPWNVVVIFGMDHRQAVLLSARFICMDILCDVVFA